MVAFKVSELTPTALAAGQVSNAPAQQLQAAAGAMQGAANTFSEFYENEARINRELILANAQADWARSFPERAKNAGPGFAETIKAEYKQYVADAMKGAPERGRDNLELAFTKYGIDLETRALQAEAAALARAKAQAAAAARRARGEALRLAGNSLISDPSQLNEFMESDPENADYYAKIALDTRMMEEPGVVAEEMQAGQWDAYLSPSEKLAFVKGGQAAAERAAREAEVALKVEQESFTDALDEELAYAQANGAPPVDSVFNEDALSSLFPDPAQREEVARVYQQSITDAEVLYNVRSAAPEELQAQMESIVAAVKEPGRTEEDVRRLDAFQTALQQRDTAIKEDAPSYVAQVSDEAAVRYDAYATAEAEDRPIAARGYVAALDANYERLGVPEPLRAVLPKQQAQAVAQQFNTMAPDIAAQSLLEYKNEWGAAAPRVIEQLSKEGLAPEYSIALRHSDNPGLAAAIVNLRGQDLNTLKAGVDTLSVSDGEKELIAALGDYRATFEAGDASGQATRVFNENYGVAERLMVQYIRTGLDPAAAAERVTTELFPEQPINMPNMQVLVPKGVEPDVVELALDNAMTEEALRAFAPAPLDDPRLPQFADEEVMIAAAQNGVWLNNSTGDGAVLHLDIGGYLLPVTGKNGQLYDVKFSQAGKASFNPMTGFQEQFQ